MSSQIWWYLARAGGIVAAVVLVGSLVLGVLLATRALREIDRPAWLLVMHRWFSTMAVVGTALHLVGLVADSYVHFGWKEILIPGASPWEPLAVGLGVIALYLLIAVQATSMLMRRIPKRLWRSVHSLSYVLVWVAIMHAALAGTDSNNRVYQVLAMTLTMMAVLAALLRVVLGRSGNSPRRRERASTPVPGPEPEPEPQEMSRSTR